MLIAVAVLAREPELVLADEPTTTLDATVQAQFLRLLVDLKDRLGNSVVFVSHDLAVVAQICDRVGVMYGGQLVELAPTAELFARPRHPYTQALLDAMPARHARGERLRAIPGTVSGSHRLPGCGFAPRCERADELCHRVVPEPRVLSLSVARCHHWRRRMSATANSPSPRRRWSCRSWSSTSRSRAGGAGAARRRSCTPSTG